MSGYGKPWTEPEDRLLSALKAQGYDMAYILSKLPGRSYSSATERWARLRRRENIAQHRARHQMALPPQTVRDLTAELMGDPLPGRSALDRRASYDPPRISLAGGSA